MVPVHTSLTVIIGVMWPSKVHRCVSVLQSFHRVLYTIPYSPCLFSHQTPTRLTLFALLLLFPYPFLYIQLFCRWHTLTAGNIIFILPQLPSAEQRAQSGCQIDVCWMVWFLILHGVNQKRSVSLNVHLKVMRSWGCEAVVMSSSPVSALCCCPWWCRYANLLKPFFFSVILICSAVNILLSSSSDSCQCGMTVGRSHWHEQDAWMETQDICWIFNSFKSS